MGMRSVMAPPLRLLATLTHRQERLLLRACPCEFAGLHKMGVATAGLVSAGAHLRVGRARYRWVAEEHIEVSGAHEHAAARAFAADEGNARQALVGDHGPDGGDTKGKPPCGFGDGERERVRSEDVLRVGASRFRVAIVLLGVGVYKA